jgi:chloramphenicol O-acetyltransferase
MDDQGALHYHKRLLSSCFGSWFAWSQHERFLIQKDEAKADVWYETRRKENAFSSLQSLCYHAHNTFYSVALSKNMHKLLLKARGIRALRQYSFMHRQFTVPLDVRNVKTKYKRSNVRRMFFRLYNKTQTRHKITEIIKSRILNGKDKVEQSTLLGGYLEVFNCLQSWRSRMSYSDREYRSKVRAIRLHHTVLKRKYFGKIFSSWCISWFRTIISFPFCYFFRHMSSECLRSTPLFQSVNNLSQTLRCID